MFVVEGDGVAIVNQKKYPLKAGVLMVIERGDTHEIRATGKSPLRSSICTCRQPIETMRTHCPPECLPNSSV